MEFKNINKFEEWLVANLKSECFDLASFLEDVDNKLCACGSLDGNGSYELKGYETKSGHAKVYRYKVEYKYIVDGEEVQEDTEDFDEVETIIVF